MLAALTPVLQDLLAIAVVAVVAAMVLSRLRLPTAAGLLLAGALVGPHGLRAVKDVGGIEALADVGVVLLLFTIGLEFSPRRLARIGRYLLVGGVLQVGLTVGATALGAVLAGVALPKAVFYGFVVSISSTAIVLRTLAERRETDAPHGRFIVGVQIFQDLSTIPMALLIPVLAGVGGGGVGAALALALAKAGLLVAAVFLLARTVLPALLRRVDATRSREVFLLAVLALCLGTAALAALAGLSLALGAFLAGVILAGTAFGGRALADVLPFQSLLASVFFVSAGMLFDARTLSERPGAVGLWLLAFLVGKGVFATIAALAMQFPARVARLAGVGLAQFGEFGFVLCGMGVQAGLVGSEELAPLFAAGIFSMFLTPVAMALAPRLSAGERVLASLARRLGLRPVAELGATEPRPSGHVVIVGYGVAGRLLAKALAGAGVPYLVLELNAETVRRARAQGERIFYGDATSAEALSHVGVGDARALVILVNDPDAATRAVRAVRALHPEVPVLLRSRYLADRPVLLADGASDVVLEEVEAGTEMVARLLRRLGLPGGAIAERVREARAAVEGEARESALPPGRLGEAADLRDLAVEPFLVGEGVHAAGRSLADLRLRTRTGALVVARRREGVLADDPDPAAPMAPGDTLFLVGRPEQVRRGVQLLETGAAEPPPPP